MVQLDPISEKDSILIARFIVFNDHKAFGKLVGRYQADVRNLLLKLTGFDEELSRDLAQDTFLRVFKYLSSFQSKARFSTWLYRITYRVYLDHYKKYQPMSLVDHNAEDSYEPGIQIDAELDFQQVISILRPEEKVAIQLAYVKGMTHAQVAEVLDCPLGTVKTLINRGKDRIRKYLNVTEQLQ